MTDQPNPGTEPNPATGPEPITPPDPTTTQPIAEPAASTSPAWTEPALPAVEPADDSAPIVAVARDNPTAGEAGTPRRASGVRWAIAIGGIAIVIGITIAVLALASGKPNTSVAVGYMPGDTVQYGEYRLDLPGDQRQKLAAFMSKFPGFADQAAIEPKIYEVFDRIVALASSNTQTFTTDIQPWFGGLIALGSGPLDPSALGGVGNDSFGGGSSFMGGGSQLFVVTVTDKAKAEAWLQKTIGDKATSTTYGDTTLYTASGFAAGVTDKVLLGGSEAVVRAAIDSKGQGKLAEDPEFKAAFSSVKQDYVAFSFIDYRSYVTAMVNLAGPAAGLDRTTIDDELLGLIPAWMSTDARFEADSLVGESSFPSVDIGYDAKNHASTLTGHVPPSTLFYAESHDVGAALKAFLDKLRAIPELSSTFGQIDQSAGLIGGLDGLFGWWGDVAVAVGPDGNGSIQGGLLIKPTNADDARKTFETLRSFIILGGGQAGLQLRDVQHGDATVTIIDFSAALARSGGVPPGVKAEIAYTVTDDVVVVGYGESFVNAVLDAGPGPSLADDERFKGLLAKVGGENLGLSYLDVQGIIALAEPIAKNLAPTEWATYEKEIKPYVDHVDALISSSRVDGGLNRLPMAFTVK